MPRRGSALNFEVSAGDAGGPALYHSTTCGRFFYEAACLDFYALVYGNWTTFLRFFVPKTSVLPSVLPFYAFSTEGGPLFRRRAPSLAEGF